MLKDRLTIEVLDWERLCATNVEDVLLNVSSQLAVGLHEALGNYQASTISDIGQRIGLDLEQQKNESMSVIQSVINLYTAASVLCVIPQIYHQTDSSMWMREKHKPHDLSKMVEGMAISILENVVGHFMAECFEECWSDLQDWWDHHPGNPKSKDGLPSIKDVKNEFTKLVDKWEYDTLIDMN